jgi:DNA repair exonuclease SbcCD ATPase subunit
MARAPLVLAGLLGQSFLPCEGISGLRADLSESRVLSESDHPRDVWRQLTMLEQNSSQPEQCEDAKPGDKCHQLVTWSLERGLVDHPEWFTTFKKTVYKERNFKAIQQILHDKGKAGCLKPCQPEKRSKPPKKSAAQLAQEKEAEEKAKKEAEAQKEAEEQAQEAKEAERRAEEKAAQEAEDAAKAAAAQAQKEAETKAEIEKVKAEIAALDAMDHFNAPSLEALKKEKHEHLESLETHLHVEMNQEGSKEQVAEKANRKLQELLMKDAEKDATADAKAQKEADEKEALRRAEEADFVQPLEPMQKQNLEDMSPAKLAEYLNHPEEIEDYANYIKATDKTTSA